MQRFWKALVTVLLAAVFWVVTGYLATLPLGVAFGWSGHPAIPAAPVAVYVLLYGVVFPALALWSAYGIVARVSAGQG